MSKNLDELLNLRAMISQMQLKIEEIMPDAIQEALAIAPESKNRIIYHNDNGRIVLNMKKKFSNNNDDLVLSKLDEDIQRISAELIRKNFNAIAEIESKIESLKNEIQQLEKEQSKLSSNSMLISLKAQYKSRREESLYLDPGLSVYLND
ncbi:hypothetical protein PN478_09530 [Dolichospermum circinale CS-534/05]|uniref:hypothetical protein n=1 Tax=Dolichospermum circinale TaxID=109265 RepID=UPI00232F1279|nr:hypothetical protein [Dolichospermum circinale]MDB9454648.1 hypothetical protein [Dolichospermum circinale CS-541/06]MDB9461439.1 hypothetical protein [Dolichospermum circinale CS-541/04]MDB9490762.1 hypothetical protein [Dolichospermum circinale CS-534/05]MDB9546450.1 hypothetical protein [Dolichospermum circinale CS-1031]